MILLNRWSWLLLVLGLLAPLDLPAGGKVKGDSQTIQIESHGGCFAGSNCHLRAYPSLEIPGFNTIPLGTSLRVVRSWQSYDKTNWLQVQATSLSLFNSTLEVHRGWINV